MKTKSIQLGIVICCISFLTSYAQELTQVIRGQVIDAESQKPLPFATIVLITTNPFIGTVADPDGKFRLEKVPVGRHDLKISFVGYEIELIPELMVSTGKEIVLTVKMKEQISEMDGIVVKAYTRKDKPLNSMSTLSARSFSVEEGRRYAGGFDDPARLASSFAGVTTGNLNNNGIIVRGNAPKGLLWRLEGIEIPNPNHFAGMTVFGGGGISALSALVLDNSDFFTGAFPAEFGNAMSGVFDIRVRSGNNEKHEHAVQLGVMGLDISSEGPLEKDTGASYLFNYRYSTFGLIRPLLPKEIRTSFAPIYQDFCFKAKIPTKSTGVFSIWGLAADDKQTFEAKTDTTLWEQLEDREFGDFVQRMGAIGLNHRYIFKNEAFLNTSMALTGDITRYTGGIYDLDMNTYNTEYMNVGNYKYTYTSVLNRKFNANHYNRTGFIINNLHYNTTLKFAPVYDQGLISVANEKGASNTLHVFSQSKFNISNRFRLNTGLHFHYFDLNNEIVSEPRLGLTYNIGIAQSVSIAYGKHSRFEPLQIYFAEVNNGLSIRKPNKDLKVAKSHHLVFAYDKSINPNLRLKIEPYVQFLFDVPVIPDSNYSILNLEADWYVNKELINTGTGANIGIDMTLERFLKDGYYYLVTASLFDSKYKGDDGIEHNSLFNSRYVINVLFGKEWVLGARNNKILGVNVRVNLLGGKRITPVNNYLSQIKQEVIYDYTRPFEDQLPGINFVYATVNYRINRKNHSSIWSLQMSNLLAADEFYGYYYNYRTNQIERNEFAVVIPNLSYKIEF
ncbi:carboxypeptidase-like regulatory domain-containing protein [Bacteroidota bacterium]